VPMRIGHGIRPSNVKI